MDSLPSAHLESDSVLFYFYQVKCLEEFGLQVHFPIFELRFFLNKGDTFKKNKSMKCHRVQWGLNFGTLLKKLFLTNVFII